MKDAAGKELQVGQIVAYAERARGSSAKGMRSSLALGKVLKFTAKQVSVEGAGWGEPGWKAPGSVAIVQDAPKPKAEYAADFLLYYATSGTECHALEGLAMDNPNVTMGDADAFNEAFYRAAIKGALGWRLLKDGVVIYEKTPVEAV